ncbi:MAG: single-stranded DNA-binding protein [Oscillospiraceae bacterium]|jgi:hypothetical protein|nr:single-stranded DNA-binding protein [Oscillospiraceae bacterium]
MFNVNDLLTIAQNEINYVNVGETFLLKELFKGYEWNRIKISDRLLLGTLFLNYANTNADKIIALKKTSSNQQKYKRI